MTARISPTQRGLPDTTQLGRVVLQVADLERSSSFYRDVLGLRLLQRTETGTDLGVAGGQPIVSLVERTGARPVPPGGSLGLYHFAVLLPDRASLGRFVVHLSELGIPAGMSDHLVSEAIYLQDPDNLGIEVYADRPRSEWRREPSGQLSMSTKPLDVRSLVAVAGDQAWTEAPVGTKLGHIHLHVGDIQEAAKFYHGALGFDTTVTTYPGALFMSAGGYHHHVAVNTWARNATAAGSGDARLIQWEIVLPTSSDVSVAETRLRDAGYEVLREGSSVATKDPWGTRARITPGV